ncbi:MAG TPA: MBL fold metallo-hydrolase [Leptospiraceae bacterium]|nr:MBL fold metallo-hydrolase [Leptospiraceae bacterium]HMX33315.1 MBL fold metallo-hydrolase [Leptospiraceae bacterium]HMY32070.1 MBL fold metallo-hydrolase [Leptospiraceae bacterium]HMZ63993.1 MBL fold metallo-hydrolase [Leptospiraceae bacterium]HNA07367.1 MBL fold metallo-hydrolase [Leptospiraceae bacterium]
MIRFILICIFTLSSCTLFYKTIKPNYFPAPQKINSPEKLEFYWIGHATVLIRFFDKWVITDPNFSSHTGIVVKRFIEPGIDLEKLEKVDFVLISHTHFDHLDQPSLRKLIGSKHILAPSGGITYIPDALFENVISVENMKEFNLDGVKITAIPVKHFGGRWLLDNFWDGEPYTGYIIEYKGVTVFFGGDTGYDDSIFKLIGKAYNIDIALIPVGPASWITGGGFGNSVHVNPFGAVQIFQDLNAKYMIPIHHSTFYRRGGSEREMILEALEKSGKKERIRLLKIGEKAEFKKDNANINFIKNEEIKK